MAELAADNDLAVKKKVSRKSTGHLFPFMALFLQGETDFFIQRVRAARTASAKAAAAAFGDGAEAMALMTDTPSAPASTTVLAFTAVMPPMATIGMVMPASRKRRRTSGPCASFASSFELVG
ncbi:hypothetical protein LR69_03666 [Geobacillus sp. BCO2]|nr:hypothetical protein LR69_03666 [Geobacillus sp. BCO2]